ncbi:GspE/PulE family protein [Aestuariibacter salexigens]|uniref:GspE/PulE family protein n=1 Tax=Aestuariibacter salexigens TaxID=226010 RepID=UPI00054DD1AE|nr:GspE/PulE family protein [Aestuariibacter salexigens]
MTRLADSQRLVPEQLDVIENTAKELDCALHSAVIRLGMLGEETVFEMLAQACSIPLIDKVSACPHADKVLKTYEDCGLNADWCITRGLFCALEGDTFHVYVADILDHLGLSVMQTAASEKNMALHLLTPAMAATVSDDVVRERAVSDLFGSHSLDIAALAEEAPVVNLVNSIIERAIQSESSDIHIEAGAKNMVVRFRVDGKMVEFMQQPMTRFPAIASRIKLMSQLDIAERRLPQDGRFSTGSGDQAFDVRVSTAPDVHGESIVMRLLPKKRDDLSLASLGMEDDHLKLMRDWGKLSNGIVLVTGPTGSGKSTTLYALLGDVKTGDEKILTVEDPVEFKLDGITQVQARADIGYTFAKALRTFLRQDPDIIMVGEIRDKETADIAVQSSLTGHLVLSTLHTNDACSVFPRLADIGVEPYLIAATIQGVQAQRLVRKLCRHCAEDAPAPEYLDVELPQGTWKKAVGCHHCHGKGYRGRMGIYELIAVDGELRSLITQQAPVADIRQAARRMGYRSLLEDGLKKAAKGLTTVEEVLRVAGSDEESS